MNEEFNLREKFPDLVPVSSGPSLFTINGCGTKLYGERDADGETGAYLTTQCFVLLYIPIFCLRTFRVLQAQSGGWYFLGREPMSLLAKGWNTLILSLIAFSVAGCWWTMHTGTPEYIAQSKLDDGKSFEQAGDWQMAAWNYHDVASGSSKFQQQGLDEFGRVLSENIADAEISVARDFLHRAVILQRRADSEFATRVIHEFCDRIVQNHRADSPAECHHLVSIVDPLVANTKDPGASREWVDRTSRELLEAAVDSEDAPIDLVVKLACALEKEGNIEQCEVVLSARQKDLGTTEGARVLGQIYSRRGEIDDAYTLLMPYMQERLNTLHSLNQQLEASYEQIQNNAISDLKNGYAPDSFYAQYNTATDSEKQELVTKYVVERIQNDPGLKQQQEQIMEFSGAVPAAIDLGILQLQRARREADPVKRQEELSQAEETFLAVRGQVGETESYRLFLGQVYFWMNRHDEGRELFQQLLDANESPQLRLQVARVYREVGSVTEARQLCEDVWSASTDEEVRDLAATLRAVMPVSIDDQIFWLRRGDQSKRHTRVELKWALAQKAETDGDEAEAIRLYREVTEEYREMPEDAGALNNEALAWFAMAKLTEDSNGFDRGIEKMERAIALMPEDSILLENCTDAILSAAVRDIVGDSVMLNKLRVSESLDLTGYLYKDQAGCDEMISRISQHAGIRRAIENFEKLTVIAPRSPEAWEKLTLIYRYLDDDESQRALWSRLEETELDMSNVIRRYEDFSSGEMDEAVRVRNETVIASARTVVDAGQDNPDATVGVAVGEILRARMALRNLGEIHDYSVDALLAKRTYAKQPSFVLGERLRTLYINQIFDSVRSQSAASQAVHADAGRELGGQAKLILSMSSDPGVATLIRQHPLYEQWTSSIRMGLEQFTKSASAVRHRLLVLCGESELAAEIDRRLRSSPSYAVSRNIRTRLYSRDLNVLMEQFLFCELLSDSEGRLAALAALQEFHAGVAQRLAAP